MGRTGGCGSHEKKVALGITAFKDNPYLDRGLMTGITRITQESVFSDLNNLRVVTTLSPVYETCFGFADQEVYESLALYGLSDHKNEVDYWYDGFQFGEHKAIYNPWSVLNYLRDLNRTHILTSNRESGFGRYDVSIEPMDKTKNGIIIEFKVFDPKKEESLADTAQRALEQIDHMNYEADLKARGVRNIRKYGFAFRGKEVLISESDEND